MNEVGYKEIEDRAIRISELIEEIIQLDELLALHETHNAYKNETQQYVDRRLSFVKELNELLLPHHLRLIVEEKAA
jgi:ribosome assembly protein YihI (activator of Der GTPase)